MASGDEGIGKGDAADGGSMLGVTLPPRTVYALGALLIGIGLAVPWLVRWQGFLRGEVPPAPAPSDRQPRALRPVLIELPGGPFWMGSPDSESNRYDDEGPRHRVAISAFEMCETEVTQGQYEAVTGNKPGGCGTECGDDDLPARNVTWFDAIEYLNALSAREGLKPCYTRQGESVTWDRGCDGYRLPTEAEWEYAARARSQTAYSFKDAELADYARYNANSDKAQPIKTVKATIWGLYDMHGNVWEWVWDWYGPYSNSAQIDPSGPAESDAQIYDLSERTWGPGQARVLRGGSFSVGAGYLRSAFRDWDSPGLRFGSGGFRCARGAAPQLGSL